MKINIKIISIFLVVINTLLLLSELPALISSSVLGIVVLSFAVTHKTARAIFKVLILISSVILIKFLFKTFLVTEAGVSLVMILAALKLWELDSENDHFNIFLILALSECCIFLLAPTFILFSLGMFKVFLFFYFILKIRNYDLSLLSGKRLLFLIAPSLFLALLLFYTFPRFTQGFISSGNNSLLFSGTESKLSFKKLGPLNLSSKVVFRVYGLNSSQFPLPLLYWRETVLWDYSKDEWRRGNLFFKSEEMPAQKPIADYRVQLVQDFNEFLPVLDGVSFISKSNLDYNFFSDVSFKLKNISRIPANYEAHTSFKEIPTILTPRMERKGLRLKSEQSEKIKELILNKKTQLQYLTDSQKLTLLVTYFKKQNYEYTLSPPAYNSIEEFILTGKSGYCSHFSAAFAFMARSIGLPARIVSGYQGGELNPFDHSLVIREMDGHSWVEVYLNNVGWTRLDPTLLVAPGRIEFGANSFNDRLEPFINLYYYQFPKSFLKFALLQRFSFWLDWLSTQLNTNVLSFDKDRQQQLLNTFIPKSLSFGILFSIILSSAMAFFWFFFNWLNNNKHDPNEKRYKKFIDRLKKEGIQKLPYESATLFRERCLLQTDNLEDYINHETYNYIKSFYERS